MGRMKEGELVRIWVKRARRGPMDARAEARLVPGSGIEGNADRGGKRQVTLLDEARWGELLRALDAEVDPSARRANLLLRGIPLAETRGQVLRIGACRLRVRGETRPCERMDEAHQGLRAAMATGWGGGVYAEVLDGGVIRVGDPAGWDDRETEA